MGALNDQDGNVAQISSKGELFVLEGGSSSTHLIFDYGSRTDTQPLYLGKSIGGTLESNSTWKVTKFRFESSSDNARIIEVDSRENIRWTNRANPSVDGQSDWLF